LKQKNFSQVPNK